MKVAIVTVGTELVRLGHRDSNSDWLTEQMQREGFDIAIRLLVGDDV